jgi:hypothetical protein
VSANLIVPEKLDIGIGHVCLIVEKSKAIEISHLLLVDGEELSYTDIHKFKGLADGTSHTDFR